MRVGRIIALLLLVMIGVLGISLIAHRIIPSSEIRALPEQATEVQEFYKNYGLDHVYVIKAKMPQHLVEAYAQKVGAEHEKSSGKMPMSFSSIETGGFPDRPGWWSPPSEILFFYNEPGFYRTIGWADGYMYYEEGSW